MYLKEKTKRILTYKTCELRYPRNVARIEPRLDSWIWINRECNEQMTIPGDHPTSKESISTPRDAPTQRPPKNPTESRKRPSLPSMEISPQDLGIWKNVICSSFGESSVPSCSRSPHVDRRRHKASTVSCLLSLSDVW